MRTYRAGALIGLVPHLPVDLLPQALAAAQAIGDEGNGTEALTGLAPHLPEPSKGQACQQALAAAQNIGDERTRAEGADRPGAAPAGGPAAQGPGRRPGHQG